MGEVLNHLLTPDTRKLDFSPMGSGTAKTARESAKSPEGTLGLYGVPLPTLIAHKGDGKRYIVHSDELLSAFLELEKTLL